MQQKQDVFWDFSIENAIWECENNCDFLSKVSKLVFWVYLRMHISYTHTSETSITNARTHTCVYYSNQRFRVYLPILFWNTCLEVMLVQFQTIDCSASPGLPNKESGCCCARTHRQARTLQSRELGTAVPETRASPLWCTAPFSDHIHLEGCAICGRERISDLENNFFSEEIIEFVEFN